MFFGIPHVAVSLPMSAKIPRDMRKGVFRYVKEYGPWVLYLLEGRTFSQKISDLQARGCSGFIGYVETEADAEILEKMNIPMVLRFLDSGTIPPKIEAFIRRHSTIRTDSPAIGKMAADYYLTTRYEHFAYVGEPNHLGWSLARENAFVRRMSEEGRDVFVYQGPQTFSFSEEMPSLCEWLRSLPKRTGVFVVHDERARQVLDASLEAKISLPNEIGILGCDNDAELCETSFPAISSVAVDAERAAYIAMRELDGLMRGKLGRHKIVYGPTQVVVRESTKLEDGQIDPLVKRALRLIEINVRNEITVEKVAQLVSMSRRQLERRFIAAGRLPIHAEINEIKLSRAQVLLKSSKSTLAEIACGLGYSSVSHFCMIYKKRFGATPRQAAKNG